MYLHDTGIKAFVPAAVARKPLPGWTGHHCWTVVAAFRIAEPGRTQHNLDAENLLAIEGPACLYCEEIWRSDIGAHCPGVGGAE